MSLKRLLNQPYFVVDLNNPGEVGSWKSQKKSHRGKTNSIYKKNWREFAAKQKPAPVSYSEKPRLQRVKKDGQIIPVVDETLDDYQRAHLKSI